MRLLLLGCYCWVCGWFGAAGFVDARFVDAVCVAAVDADGVVGFVAGFVLLLR